MSTPFDHRDFCDRDLLGQIRESTIVGANFTCTRFRPGKARIEDTTFRDSFFTGAGFERATLARTEFLGCSLKRTNFYNTKLEDCLFHRCDLDSSSWDGCTLKNVVFSQCYMPRIWNLKHESVIWLGSKVSQVVIADEVKLGVDISIPKAAMPYEGAHRFYTVNRLQWAKNILPSDVGALVWTKKEDPLNWLFEGRQKA